MFPAAKKGAVAKSKRKQAKSKSMKTISAISTSGTLLLCHSGTTIEALSPKPYSKTNLTPRSLGSEPVPKDGAGVNRENLDLAGCKASALLACWMLGGEGGGGGGGEMLLHMGVLKLQLSLGVGASSATAFSVEASVFGGFKQAKAAAFFSERSLYRSFKSVCSSGPGLLLDAGCGLGVYGEMLCFRV